MLVHISSQALLTEVDPSEVLLKCHVFWHLFNVIPVRRKAHDLEDLFQLIVVIRIRRFNIFLAAVEDRLGRQKFRENAALLDSLSNIKVEHKPEWIFNFF